MLGELDEEFRPLPYFSWSVRPTHLALEVEECATALYLSDGVIERAAERLRVSPLRLVRSITRSARLSRLHAELAALLNDKVHQEYIRAFADEDSRRREWASSKVAQSKQFQGHPLAPNAQNGAIAQLTGPTAITIHWGEAPKEEASDQIEADG